MSGDELKKEDLISLQTSKVVLHRAQARWRQSHFSFPVAGACPRLAAVLGIAQLRASLGLSMACKIGE